MTSRIEGWAECNGVSLHYAVSGTGSRSLVLFHGLGSTLDAWEPVAQMLEREFRILRFDQRGAGQSEKVRHAFTLADLIADTAALIAAVGLPAPYYLASQSAGAAVALAFAAAHQCDVTALGLCAPSLGATPERARLLIERGDRAISEGIRAVVEETLARSYPAALRTDEVAFETYRARLLAADPVCYAHANRVLATSDLDGVVASLDVPCLVLAGRADVMRPPALLAQMVGRMKRAELVEIDAPHIMIVYSPGVVAEACSAFMLRRSV
jgi:3-oxoadipate enol-lactonase